MRLMIIPYYRETMESLDPTVDERIPAPAGMYKTL